KTDTPVAYGGAPMRKLKLLQRPNKRLSPSADRIRAHLPNEYSAFQLHLLVRKNIMNPPARIGREAHCHLFAYQIEMISQDLTSQPLHSSFWRENWAI